QHIGKGITEEQRKRWVWALSAAADEAGLPTDAEFRAAFTAYLEWGSRLAIENSTPGALPPEGLPVPRWWWVCDATPGARISALERMKAAQEGAQMPGEAGEPVLPGEDEEISFAEHIKALFRPTDRQAMKFAFDLWAYEDVKEHGAAILARLRNGSMPCDGGWPAERISAFERWVESGCPE
ncbi:MAG: hypothetical protein ACJ786_13195, partial [Catenulispora sp.]